MLSGCAAMFNGTTDTIHVRSHEENTIFFANEREIGRGLSATTVIAKKELGRTVLRAEKEGFHPATAAITTRFDATTLLGVLLDWGIVSVFIVDGVATGAIRRAAQTEYVLTPQPIETGS